MLFDEAAAGFASAIDKSVAAGRYSRGGLFAAAIGNSLKPGSYILDYGCGPGRISAALARRGYRVLGVDPSPAMIEVAKAQPLDGLDIDFRSWQPHPAALPAGPFDAIVCSSVIEYVTESQMLLGAFSSALRPSGVLIITFPNNLSIWGALCLMRKTSPFQPLQKQRWSGPAFLRLLKRSGFQPAGRVAYFDSPFDRQSWLRNVGLSPLAGTLGLVSAVAEQRPGNGEPEDHQAQ